MATQLINPHDCMFIQSRAEVNFSIVDEYAALMEMKTIFEPVKGMIDENSQIYIWDGYHRGEAAKKSGIFLHADLVNGTRADAEWQALSANITHGLRRTQKDIERVVKAALKLKPDSSDRDLERHCGVHHSTVSKYRKELEASGEISQIDTRTVKRNGTAYQMQTKRQLEIQNPPEPHIPTKVSQTWETRGFGVCFVKAIVHDRPRLYQVENLNNGRLHTLMDDELVSQIITPEEEAKELNTQAKVRLAEKGIIAKSYVEEEQERMAAERQKAIEEEESFFSKIENGEEPDDNRKFLFHTTDRNKIMRAGLRLFRIEDYLMASGKQILELKEYSQSMSKDACQGCGSWKRFERFETKAAMKRRIVELEKDQLIVFENHLKL